MRRVVRSCGGTEGKDDADGRKEDDDRGNEEDGVRKEEE